MVIVIGWPILSPRGATFTTAGAAKSEAAGSRSNAKPKTANLGEAGSLISDCSRKLFQQRAIFSRLDYEDVRGKGGWAAMGRKTDTAAGPDRDGGGFGS
jgi:hypothetical protein